MSSGSGSGKGQSTQAVARRPLRPFDMHFDEHFSAQMATRNNNKGNGCPKEELTSGADCLSADCFVWPHSAGSDATQLAKCHANKAGAKEKTHKNWNQCRNRRLVTASWESIIRMHTDWNTGTARTARTAKTARQHTMQMWPGANGVACRISQVSCM